MLPAQLPCCLSPGGVTGQCTRELRFPYLALQTSRCGDSVDIHIHFICLAPMRAFTSLICHGTAVSHWGPCPNRCSKFLGNKPQALMDRVTGAGHRGTNPGRRQEGKWDSGGTERTAHIRVSAGKVWRLPVSSPTCSNEAGCWQGPRSCCGLGWPPQVLHRVSQLGPAGVQATMLFPLFFFPLSSFLALGITELRAFALNYMLRPFVF